jgi:hypothetical protein
MLPSVVAAKRSVRPKKISNRRLGTTTKYGKLSLIESWSTNSTQPLLGKPWNAISCSSCLPDFFMIAWSMPLESMMVRGFVPRF